MPGAQCTRSLACKVESTRVSHHRYTGIHPAFPHAMVYGLFRALPGARALWSPSSRGYLPRNLAPASRRQDHTNSPSATRALVRSAPASTASRPALMTLRNAPFVGRDGDGYRGDLGIRKSRIFFQKGLDGVLAKQPVGQISWPVGRARPTRLLPPSASQRRRQLSARHPAPILSHAPLSAPFAKR